MRTRGQSADSRSFGTRSALIATTARTLPLFPSHAEFETLFSFAKDFYEVVADSIIAIGPAAIARAVGRGFVRLIGVLGVPDAKFDFENDT